MKYKAYFGKKCLGDLDMRDDRSLKENSFMYIEFITDVLEGNANFWDIEYNDQLRNIADMVQALKNATLENIHKFHITPA